MMNNPHSISSHKTGSFNHFDCKSRCSIRRKLTMIEDSGRAGGLTQARTDGCSSGRACSGSDGQTKLLLAASALISQRRQRYSKQPDSLAHGK